MTSETHADNAQYLERISLNEKAIYFHRMREDIPANYYHWHQCVEILSISQGVGIALVDRRQYTIRPGRLFIFPPGRLHKVFVEQNEQNKYHRTTVHFNALTTAHYLRDFPRQLALLQQLTGPGEHARVFDTSDVQGALDMLLERFEKQMEDDLFTRSDSAFLVMQILSLLPHIQPEYGQKTFSTRLIHWIDEHFTQPCTLDDIARIAGCSRGHTCRRFHEETGGTLQEYLIMRRLRQACELLIQTSLSVREIAKAVGFSGYPWFITCFSKHIGISPLQYRKSCGVSLNMNCGQ